MVNAAVAVKNLHLSFGDHAVLHDVSIDFIHNSVTSIIGPSGCGKSTLLRTINRMNDFVESVRINGEIMINDENILSPACDVYSLRSHVGMVFQKPNPFPKSIFDNVAFGLRIQGMKQKTQMHEIVEHSLKAAWLWDEVKDRLHAPAFSLSGGQQQRLCIARALATGPQVLLLDEPTSALDPQSTHKVEELLLELKQRVTVCIVTHNIGQAGRVSDYTAFMYLGKLIEYGPTQKMFTVPKHAQTEQYLSGKFG